jgi:hypothetical protein
MNLTLAALTIVLGALGMGLALDLRFTHRRIRELETENRIEQRRSRDLESRLEDARRSNVRLTNEIHYLRRTEVFLITQTPPEPRGWSLNELLKNGGPG